MNVEKTKQVADRKGEFCMKEKITEHTSNGIKVTVHIPENVSDSVKRNRINQIYDILKSDKNDTDTKDVRDAKVS